MSALMIKYNVLLLPLLDYDFTYLLLPLLASLSQLLIVGYLSSKFLVFLIFLIPVNCLFAAFSELNGCPFILLRKRNVLEFSLLRTLNDMFKCWVTITWNIFQKYQGSDVNNDKVTELVYKACLIQKQLSTRCYVLIWSL